MKISDTEHSRQNIEWSAKAGRVPTVPETEKASGRTPF
jgi:hypothetical protein